MFKKINSFICVFFWSGFYAMTFKYICAYGYVLVYVRCVHKYIIIRLWFGHIQVLHNNRNQFVMAFVYYPFEMNK